MAEKPKNYSKSHHHESTDDEASNLDIEKRKS